MHNFKALSALALYLTTCHAVPQAVLVQKRPGGEQVVKMDPGAHFHPGDKSVPFKMDPDSDFESSFSCKESTGKELTPSSDGLYVGCCLPGQELLGTEKTTFLCCGKQHVVSGNNDVGFSCCPEGQTFDGKVCHAPPAPTPDPPKPSPDPPHPSPNPPNPDPPITHCANGKKLVNGKCVCPGGTKETEKGMCATAPCTSDISYGKCYMFKFHNGEFYGSASDGVYYAAPAAINYGNGVFTFCPDANCTDTGPIGANDTFLIKDLRGRPAAGYDPGWFLGKDANGDHVRKRNDPHLYGNYSISKFPECGKYCLGGSSDGGLYYACPSTTPALTFWTLDRGVCVPIELLEVPCDFHDPKVNCAWEGGCDAECGCDTPKKVAGPPTPHHVEL